ncbi:venom carboxylesterase-6 [Anoplophora glabripennis]|uniref:venom carboxylesterase-6 n=1 Tax=Anoplophora glabripennis TaxID=217634 RepID=UPI000C77183D|nr:venom carboxylesterase-6 [Anoplophora glabripennis]
MGNWEGVLDTTKNTKICVQGSAGVMQDEDCLYLNVYTPVTPGTEAKLPVLVFIHGGGFIRGSGVYGGYGPEFFMDTGRLVVVTINYRLGPFGFLSTEDDIIPGNYGLKDQRFALQWVQDNIHLFGGDPLKVTIDGQSAGSASVSYHVLSNQSKGLFRAAIHESGTVLTSWGYQRYARDIAYKTAAALDSSITNSNSSAEVLEVLQKVTARELQDAANIIPVPTKHINPGYIFAPVVESGDDAFFTELAYEAVEKGNINKVKMIVGMNSEEWIARVSSLDFFKQVLAGYDQDLTQIVNDDFHIQNESLQLTIAKKIRDIYTEGLFQDDLGSSLRFMSDCRYTANIIKYAQIVSQFADVYFYQFSYDGELGGGNLKISGAESVGHSEELQYLWRTNRNDDIEKFAEADVLTHKRILKLWTNFVTDLNPTPEADELLQNISWPVVESNNFQYLDIREDLTVKINPKEKVFESWDNIYQTIEMSNKYCLIYFILHTSTYFLFVFSEESIITISNGQIKGRVAKTFKNSTFYAFQEIPYAAPPVGSLRFKPPIPVNNWDGILDTTKNTKICIQAGGTNTMQNEDCLYLNVYTPVIPDSDEKLPVLFFIHGGKFLSGDGIYTAYGPDFFMDTQKLVVVVINYRLGPFGFLSTEDEVIPGNNGLKDQRFALQWVQENIQFFGGDPSQVTLVGQSAGSASVSYHVQSKKSTGLFRAAICESGTVLTPWSYQRYARDIAYQTAAAIDNSFTTKNTSQELLTLLQGVSAKELQAVAADQISVPSKHINTGFIFAPVIESGEDAVATDLSYEILERGEINKVPMIIGMNSEEAITQVNSLGSFKKVMRTYDNDLTIIVNDDLHVDEATTQLTIGESIRKIYTDGLFQDDLASSVRFISDSRYSMNIIKYAQIISNFTEVYFYQFSYDGELGNVDSYIDGAESVAHSEELQYLWRNSRNDDIEQFSEADVLTHKRLIKMWTNFATRLNPTFESDELLENITWPQVASNNFQYLDIREELTVKTNPKGNVFTPWDTIFTEYAVRPYDTY